MPSFKRPRKGFFTFKVRLVFYVLFALALASLIIVVFIHDSRIEKRRPVLPVTILPNVVITNSDPLLEEIKRNLNLFYFQTITPDEMEDNMRKGMVEQLHEYCYYVEKDDGRPRKTIGALLAVRSGHYFVRYVAPDSPAKIAGIREGDEIISVDDQEITHRKDVFDEESYLASDKVILGIVRNNKTFYIISNKKELAMPSVICKKIDGFLYIQIRSFKTNTGEEFIKCIGQFSNVRGYVIDLRDNPGGSAKACKFIASYFLPPEKILYIQNFRNLPQSTSVSFVKEGCTDKPLVILINGNSYSASEVVSAVLQYHKRALIVGEQSGGKGISQIPVELSNGDSLSIPNSYLFLPDGTTWNENGVVPDYEIAPGLPVWTFGDILPQNDSQLKKAISLLKAQTKK